MVGDFGVIGYVENNVLRFEIVIGFSRIPEDKRS
jgi:hypothetical protein